ncbi:MAG: hypothetical protein KDD50_13385 [Bdellovibrionales bacterium]|nr:hypothetical protein [Bdellovibrionales bacterium]
MSFYRACTTIILIFFTSLGLLAGERTDRPIGLNFAVNEPYPGGVGVNLMINATNWLRISGGSGYYNDQFGQSLSDIPVEMIAVMVYIMTAGNTPIEDSVAFLKGNQSSATPKIIRSYSGGIELLHPSWKTSPVIGVFWGGYEPQNQPYDLTEFAVHKYFKAGIDYTSETGFNIQLGGLYAEELPEPIRYRGYIHFGHFF